MKIAIIDIGSNSVRLVIYSLGKEIEKKVLYNEKEFALLRSYYDHNGGLSNEGIDKLLEILSRFKQVIQEYDVDHCIPFATASLRGAYNVHGVLAKVKKELNMEIKVFSEMEESFLGYYSVIHSLPYKEGITVDLGGGSTEITYFRNKQLINQISLPFGTIALKNLGYTDDEIDLEAVSDYVYKGIKELFWLKDSRIPLILIGGSARNMVKAHRSFNAGATKLHGYELIRSEITRTKIRLQEHSFEEIRNIKGFSEGREYMIVPAAELFDTIANFSRASKVVLSKEGIREGVLYNYIKEKRV